MKTMDYSKDLAKAEHLLRQKHYADATRACERILEHALKDLYALAKTVTRAGVPPRLEDSADTTSRDTAGLDAFTVDQLLGLFQEERIFSRLTPLLRGKDQSTFEPQFQGIVAIRNKCAATGFNPPGEDAASFCLSLKIFLKESGLPDAAPQPQQPATPPSSPPPQSTLYAACPACGEAIRKNWKLCPACETPLAQLACPRCGRTVKENWKRCPECESRLICPSCSQRIPHGYRRCPECEFEALQNIGLETTFTDPVSGIEFLRVHGGMFMMGDTFGDGVENELPVHEVKLKDFYMAKHPVMQNQWQRVMQNNPSKFKGELHPVEQVTWRHVQAFIDRLISINEGKYTYRLPSEAEWEYAARSGGRGEKYAGGNKVDIVAWYGENSNDSTHPVGEKAPNGCGLYDMSGNVWEWCLDVYHENAYTSHLEKSPLCTEGGSDRVIRGGSWHLDAWSVRCARRLGFPPDYYGPGLGFRLVKVI
jgi:formylglycine-generating enzyme required for sulfatase activity